MRKDLYFLYADVKIDFNQDRIIWTRASKQLNIGYEEIRKIDDTNEYIYILINTQSVIWIPNEAFISIEARKNFLNYVNLKVKQKQYIKLININENLSYEFFEDNDSLDI